VTVASQLLAGDDTQKAGPLGLLVLIILGIVCYFLFRSMSSHLRKVNTTFPVEANPASPNPASPNSRSPNPRSATASSATAAAPTDDEPDAPQEPTTPR
jgi:hypothetical protein